MKDPMAEISATVARVEKLQKLLQYFGVELISCDPGFCGTIPVPDSKYKRTYTVSVDGSTWSWLEPLLIELKELRESTQDAKDEHSWHSE